MSKRSGITKRLEVWTVGPTNAKTTIIKTAVRRNDGTFHGATNFAVRKTQVSGTPQA